MPSSQNAPDAWGGHRRAGRVGGNAGAGTADVRQARAQPEDRSGAWFGQRSPSSRANFPTSKANWAIRTLASARESAGLT
jgi:hypothetical protein